MAGAAIQQIGQGIVNGAKQVGQALSNALAISPVIKTDVPINLTPGNQVQSPWGQALQLFHKERTSQIRSLTAN